MRPEIECRRPEFTEGYKVKLGDGQTWTFPKPVLRLVPVRKEGGGFGMKESPPYGADYQDELTRYIDSAVAAEDEVSAGEVFCQRIGLAVKLLERNYVLTDEDLQELFYLERDDEKGASEMWDEIDAVMFGRSPKASAVGSDAPSSPTA